MISLFCRRRRRLCDGVFLPDSFHRQLTHCTLQTWTDTFRTATPLLALCIPGTSSKGVTKHGACFFFTHIFIHPFAYSSVCMGRRGGGMKKKKRLEQQTSINERLAIHLSPDFGGGGQQQRRSTGIIREISPTARA